MPLHPAWAKNVARRVLWAALENDISKAERLSMANFFDQKCVYCGESLAARWHADHLISVDQGGSNHISNRVPSCARCNEKEKKEMDWNDFLSIKCAGDLELFTVRKEKIQAWQAIHESQKVIISDEVRKVWSEEIAIVSAAIDASWKRIKNAKNNGG